MRSQVKRMDKLSAGLPPKERCLAIADAVQCEEMDTAMSLLASTPKKNYLKRDAAVTDFVMAVEITSLMFDRGFYAQVATLLAVGQSDRAESSELRKEVESELCAFVAGMVMLAGRVGLSTHRLLAFSIALEHDVVKHYQKDLETLSEKEKDLANEICLAMGEVWSGLAAHTPFTVAANA
jgi:hypothetical protein